MRDPTKAIICALFVSLGSVPPLRADDVNRPAGGSEPILVLDTGGHIGRVMTVLFTPDGKQLISVSHDKTIRTWDVITGTPLRVLRPPIGPGPQGMLYAEALSPDGRTLATGGNSQWSGKSHIYLIDLDTGHLARVLTGHTGSATALAFSPDGTRLASASLDHTARIWNPTEGRCERVLSGHEDQIYGLAFSPDGRRLATASHDKTGRIWSLADGRCEAVLRGHQGEVQCVAWRPDGQVVATGGWEGAIRQWAPDGSAYQGFENLGEVITSLKFTANSRGLLYTRNCWGASLLDLATRAERVKFVINKDSVLHGALSPDGTLAATSDGYGEIYLWRTADAATVHHLAGRGRGAWAVAWNRDGEAIAWGNTKNSDSANDFGPLERVFRPAVLGLSDAQRAKHNAGRGKDDSVRRSFRRADTTLGSLALEETQPTTLAVKRYGSTIATIQLENPREKIYSYSLLPGDRAIVGTILGLYLYDTRSGKLLRQYRGHTGVITSLAYSPERRYLLSGSRDQTLCVWDLDHDQPLMSLFVAGNDWVAWTPQGYYAASPAGEELMGWHVNNGLDAMASFYPASQFRKTLYRPDVIKRLLHARSLEKALAEADTARRQASRPTEVAQVLPPKVAITTPAVAKLALSTDTLEVHAIAKSSGAYPVTALRLLLDGRPVHEGLKTFPNPRLGEARGSWTVAVPPGNHRLIVLADSEVSEGLSEPVEVARTCGGGEPAKGMLYVLAVGINAYPDKQLKLDWAAPDAEYLSEAFLNHSRRLFREIEPRLLLDGQATRAEIFRELRRLSATAKAGDVAVVFYAGHGYRKHMSQFYLVPVDANVSTLPDLGQSGIAGEDLRKEMGDLPCTTMLMLDACEADSINDLLHEMVYDSRVVVMCGAGKDQSAVEENGHGHFTRAIVEGMGGQAESNKDGQIGLLELQTYVHQRVLELSFGEQEPTIVIPKIVGSFPLSQPKRAEAHSTP